MSEIGLRCLYFQIEGISPLALMGAYSAASQKFDKFMVDRKRVEVEDHRKKYRGSYRAFYSAEGKELLDEFKVRYEASFRSLVEASEKAQTKFVVLYIPSTSPQSTKAKAREICRKYFKGLALKYNIDFLDTTHDMHQYDWDRVSLAPENGHLSRLGNKVVAERLGDFLERFADYRSPTVYDRTRTVYADLPPDNEEIWNIMPSMPYRVVTNREGFRNKDDVEFPKTRQRVLLLGDSFTFGPYLPNHHTYPSLLQNLKPELEVLNAGIAGHTITDEASLFIDKAQFVAPDITVLQVLDNDLYGLFYFKMNEFDRNKKHYTPSALEKSFLDKLVKRNAEKVDG